MDLKLQHLARPLGARPVFIAVEGEAQPRALPGNVHFICSSCPGVVATNVPLGGLMNVVFRCTNCGAEREIPRTLPRRI